MTATRVLPDGDAARAEAVALLRAGLIVAIPTDTVYGIAADLALPDAIERLFAAKRRPPEKAVAVLLADAAQAWSLGVASPAASLLAERFWPGGLTLVLPVRPGVRLPGVLAAGTPTIGVRVPDHAAPRALAAALGPLPTTSANLSGRPDASDAHEVAATLGECDRARPRRRPDPRRPRLDRRRLHDRSPHDPAIGGDRTTRACCGPRRGRDPARAGVTAGQLPTRCQVRESGAGHESSCPSPVATSIDQILPSSTPSSW